LLRVALWKKWDVLCLLRRYGTNAAAGAVGRTPRAGN